MKEHLGTGREIGNWMIGRLLIGECGERTEEDENLRIGRVVT